MGLMAPGGRVTLNVPIRTVCIDTPPPLAPWRARCGIGSGITLDSTPEGEAQEWQQKRTFLHRADEPFELLESLRLDDGQIPRLALHLARLARGARHFGFPWSELVESKVHALLTQASQAHPQGVFKLRLLLNVHGQPTVHCTPLGLTPTPIHVSLAPRAMPMTDDFIRHKTTRRQAYAAFAPAPGCFDTLLYNAQGELTEFTIGNLALQLGDQWLTPPLCAGLLPGVMRQSLLDQGILTEHPLRLDDLSQARGMVLINSVRGWLEVATIPTHTSNRNPP
jgi:para-aminobenzoate synthetase/4-amino-4-deoxychorismate lyase